jgi:hypothetical protein
MMTSSMTASGPQKDPAWKAEAMACQRSCSANQVQTFLANICHQSVSTRLGHVSTLQKIMKSCHRIILKQI